MYTSSDKPPKHSQTPEPLRSERVSHLNQRWKQLYELQMGAIESGFRYLLLINSGGAVATLSFIGAVGKDKIGHSVKISLGLFILGIVFSGFSRAKQFYRFSGMLLKWQDQFNSYLNNELHYEELIKDDESRSKDDRWDHLLPWGAFVFFIVGCVMGLCVLW